MLAVVEEARNAGTYVAAHLYTDEAIHRAIHAGVHSLEHCNLIRRETADTQLLKGVLRFQHLWLSKLLPARVLVSDSPRIHSRRLRLFGLKVWNP
ncbi:hypothetical protein T190_12145 [Sinorhizobium meliloti CCBAU 01290]|nr:hypothetical protein T190_12145 [Sinorhizobium meliloti CCBAU 01290]